MKDGPTVAPMTSDADANDHLHAANAPMRCRLLDFLELSKVIAS